LRIGYIYNELQLLTCIERGLWSTNTRYKYFKKGDLILFITQETYVGFVAVARFNGEPYESNEKILNEHNYHFRYPVEFLHVIPLVDRVNIDKNILAILHMNKGLVLGQKAIEEVYMQKNLKPASHGRLILEEVEKLPNILEFYLENLQELIREAKRRPEMHWDGTKYLNCDEETLLKFPLNNYYLDEIMNEESGLIIPVLEPVQRSREYQEHDENTRNKVVFEYLFKSRTYRWIDENVIGLNPSESREYQSMGILHHIGLKGKHKGVFSGYDVPEAIRVLHRQRNDFGMVIQCLEQFNNKEAQNLNFIEFDYDLFEKSLHNQEYHMGKKTKYYILTVKISKSVDSQNIKNTYTVYILENDEIIKKEQLESEEHKNLLSKAKRLGFKLLHDVHPNALINDVTMVHYKQDRPNAKPWEKESYQMLLNFFEDYQGEFERAMVKTAKEDIESEQFEEGEYYRDGSTTYYFGKRYERNPQNRAKAIKIHGLNCLGCGFNFKKMYGERGEDFIEIHHIKPLSTIQEEVVINPATDLVPVCSNCHRMIHRKKDRILTIEELRELIKK
jgi:hypothetical protein